MSGPFEQFVGLEDVAALNVVVAYNANGGGRVAPPSPITRCQFSWLVSHAVAASAFFLARGFLVSSLAISLARFTRITSVGRAARLAPSSSETQ